MCKGCRCLALPQINTKVRIKKKNINWSCTICGVRKRYKIEHEEYTPWPLTEEAVVEVLDYTPTSSISSDRKIGTETFPENTL